MLTKAVFLREFQRIEDVFRRPGGFSGHETYYQAVAPAFNEASWEAAVTAWLAHGERFPFPADLLKGRGVQAQQGRHACGQCRDGWVYETQTEYFPGGQKRDWTVMVPCTNRRDKYATAFRAKLRGNLGPGADG